jgi:hypothetical protein
MYQYRSAVAIENLTHLLRRRRKRRTDEALAEPPASKLTLQPNPLGCSTCDGEIIQASMTPDLRFAASHNWVLNNFVCFVEAFVVLRFIDFFLYLI